MTIKFHLCFTYIVTISFIFLIGCKPDPDLNPEIEDTYIYMGRNLNVSPNSFVTFDLYRSDMILENHRASILRYETYTDTTHLSNDSILWKDHFAMYFFLPNQTDTIKLGINHIGHGLRANYEFFTYSYTMVSDADKRSLSIDSLDPGLQFTWENLTTSETYTVVPDHSFNKDGIKSISLDYPLYSEDRFLDFRANLEFIFQNNDTLNPSTFLLRTEPLGWHFLYDK